MALKKDKQKVLDAVWTQEHIQSFLELQPPQGECADFHRLLRAYQSMRAHDFEDFIRYFVQAGGNLQAVSLQNQLITDIIQKHRHGQAYLDILKAA